MPSARNAVKRLVFILDVGTFSFHGRAFRCSGMLVASLSAHRMWLRSAVRLRSAAQFRFAPSTLYAFSLSSLTLAKCSMRRSRASPYEKWQKQIFFCASTTKSRLHFIVRLRSAARFRFAPSRSRASPYEKWQKQIFFCASTTKICFRHFSHCSLPA